MEQGTPPQELQILEDTWGEIRRFMDQPDFLETHLALALTSKQLYAVFGGYRFVLDQDGLDRALQQQGEVKAIVLYKSGLTVSQAPACQTPEGKPTPVVSYGSDTAVNKGTVSVRNATVAASGNARVDAESGSTVILTGNAFAWVYSGATVLASGTSSVVTVSESTTVTASGQARVRANAGSMVTASGNARVQAAEGSTVSGQGSEVIIFYMPGADVSADDPQRTLRQVTFEELRDLSWDELEAAHPAPE